jgi:hypothetical protein
VGGGAEGAVGDGIVNYWGEESMSRKVGGLLRFLVGSIRQRVGGGDSRP